jgi:hypothetical protein
MEGGAKVAEQLEASIVNIAKHSKSPLFADFM